MTENGVAYVWLRDEGTKDDTSADCTDHRFVLLDSVKASCLTLGYDRYLCTGRGKIEKRDYANALGHSWQGIVVRDATCEDGGKLFEICSRCGYHRLEGDAAKGHTPGNPATCTAPQTCTKCGAVLKNALGHGYKGEATAPTCEKMGYTTRIIE